MRGGGWRLCMGRCLTRGTVSDSSREGCAVAVVRSKKDGSFLCTAYASEFEEVNVGFPLRLNFIWPFGNGPAVRNHCLVGLSSFSEIAVG